MTFNFDASKDLPPPSRRGPSVKGEPAGARPGDAPDPVVVVESDETVLALERELASEVVV